MDLAAPTRLTPGIAGKTKEGRGVRELAEEGGPLTVESAAEMGRKDPSGSFLQRATSWGRLPFEPDPRAREGLGAWPLVRGSGGHTS